MATPEELAREKIDKLLSDCGWTIQNRSTINFSAARGVAILELRSETELLAHPSKDRDRSDREDRRKDCPAVPIQFLRLLRPLASYRWSAARHRD